MLQVVPSTVLQIMRAIKSGFTDILVLFQHNLNLILPITTHFGSRQTAIGLDNE